MTGNKCFTCLILYVRKVKNTANNRTVVKFDFVTRKYQKTKIRN